MLEFIIFYLTILCTNPTPHVPGPKCNGIHVIFMDNETGGGTGGETGDIPPPPPPPKK